VWRVTVACDCCATACNKAVAYEGMGLEGKGGFVLIVCEGLRGFRGGAAVLSRGRSAAPEEESHK